MDTHFAALGRDVGKVDTDSGGIARYSLKLQVPPGIGNGNEPELSLEYAQGCPNGSLGTGWALGGVSAIRTASSNLAFDGVNMEPADYNRSEPKLMLDGAELLKLKGVYGAADAEYTTETDATGRTVTPLGGGFLVQDLTGRRSEYGTTDDSRVLISGQQEVREWRLKRTVDYHGNGVTYNYVKSPQSDNLAVDVNTCYLSNIRYTSNEKTGHQGNRLVQFEYSSRPDLVVQTVQGDKVTWGSLISAIRFGVVRADNIRITRSYEIAYSTSQHTGDSRIISVTETSVNRGEKVNLLPATFEYTTMGVAQQDLFKTGQLRSLEATVSNVALFTMNISGRCLADLACIRWDPNSGQMSIKTYLADRKADGTIDWYASSGPGAEATLPSIDMSNGFPSILSPDMNGDGRADFVVPYPDFNQNIQFSISQCVGTGYRPAIQKATSFKWTSGSKFMAMDLTGRGRPDVVQIFSDEQKLTLRNFPGFVVNGEIGLRDATTFRTEYNDVGTIDWCQVRNARTGAQSLVRIWSQNIGQGHSQIKATNFTAANKGDSSAGFLEGTTSLLGNPVHVLGTKYTVIPCDINADGTQDIVLATAEYRGTKMVLTYITYLGDGYGGFQQHGGNITREISAPIPLNLSEDGTFHSTNLNGSNYPSLCYVYQERDSPAFFCVTVDGTSSGLVGDPSLYRIAGDLPTRAFKVVAADLNGNGMGDWLLYTLENDAPRVIPAYNNAKVTDFLLSAQDSTGLRSTLSYGCLSDPAVYTSTVDWENYVNNSEDSYPVIAAPNYVVTAIEHRNNSSINSFDYHVIIKKDYGGARINTRGRGWQGFGTINTLNASDNILTTEEYLQTWPLACVKWQIITKNADTKQELKRIKSSYKASFKTRGPWNIYRTDKILDQIDMLEDGSVVRSNSSIYEHDEYGNTVLQCSSETQRNHLMFKCWKRCSYTIIDGVTGVLTGEKVSANENNLNMTAFEQGDLSLTCYENDTSRAILKSLSEWSTDSDSFATKYFTFNDYGKEIEVVNAAGLRKLTAYDEHFQSNPIKVTEEGPGVSTVMMSAFDEASGLEVARLDLDGLLTCYALDGFGRTYEIRAKAAAQGPDTVKASEFFVDRPLVVDSGFSSLLSGVHLDPQRKISFERQKSLSGTPYIAAKVINYSKEGVNGQSETVEYVDCAKQTRKRSLREADATEKVWAYWEYDSRGQYLFQSFPTKVPISVDLEWIPDRSFGTRSTFDTLGRPITRVRPAHANQNHFITNSTTYLDGGARIQEEILISDDANSPLTGAKSLASLERRYVRIGKEELVVENIDENGLRSQFQYDVLGRLIKCIDALGQTEVRSYNSRGDLIVVDNVYQNSTGVEGTSAIKYEYNAARQLVGRTNAAGEVITYLHDAKDRVLREVGHDGRTIQYTYNAEGLDRLSSIRIFPSSATGPYESLFEFDHDHSGRISQRKVTLASGDSFTTSILYDWQSQVIQKVLPDGAIMKHDYRGSEITSSLLSGGAVSSWSLKAEIPQYSAYQKPEKLLIQGTGMKESFTHNWEYDSQGFPTSHSLGTDSKSLVIDHYLYNDLDQIARKHEMLTGSTTDYLYQGKRLLSSQTDNASLNSYAYDAVGNLLNKCGTAYTYAPGRVTGTKDGKSTFDVRYDDAGRTKQRVTDRSAFAFTYNSLGALEEIKDTSKGTSIEFLADFDGETLHRKCSDGSSDLYISRDFTIHIQPDGSRIVRHKLGATAADESSTSGLDTIATISNTFESPSSTRPLQGQRVMNIQFTDTKGNVTHVFNSTDGSVAQKFDYDDFGLLQVDATDVSQSNDHTTYEGNYFDSATGLLNFSARWYDPLVGRFITPDNILDLASLMRTDGLNRYAFENNDPINNIDPTGHWSWSSVLGAVASGVLIFAAVVVTVLTGGAASLLAAAAVGALASGGLAGLSYSFQHSDEKDAGKFWAGWGTTVAINAAIGAVTGAAASAASGLSAAGRIVATGAIGGVSSVLSQAAQRGVDNFFYGKHHDLFEGAAGTFIFGAIAGAIAGALSSGPKPTGGVSGSSSTASQGSGAFKLTLRSSLSAQPTNTWLNMSRQAIVKQGAQEFSTHLNETMPYVVPSIKYGVKAIIAGYKGYTMDA